MQKHELGGESTVDAVYICGSTVHGGLLSPQPATAAKSANKIIAREDNRRLNLRRSAMTLAW